MTSEEFTGIVQASGEDDEAARRLQISRHTVRALRSGHKKITPRIAAFIAMVLPDNINEQK